MTLFYINDPDYKMGANKPSLRQGQRNYLIFGACDERFISSVREPLIDEIKDSDWKILS